MLARVSQNGYWWRKSISQRSNPKFHWGTFSTSIWLGNALNNRLTELNKEAKSNWRIGAHVENLKRGGEASGSFITDRSEKKKI